MIEHPFDYYVGAGASTEHEVTVALTLKVAGTDVSDPATYFAGTAVIKLGGTGKVTFKPRTVQRTRKADFPGRITSLRAASSKSRP